MNPVLESEYQWDLVDTGPHLREEDKISHPIPWLKTPPLYVRIQWIKFIDNPGLAFEFYIHNANCQIEISSLM